MYTYELERTMEKCGMSAECDICAQYTFSRQGSQVPTQKQQLPINIEQHFNSPGGLWITNYFNRTHGRQPRVDHGRSDELTD